MAEKVKGPKVKLEDFLSDSQQNKAGKVELLGAFGHYMLYTKRITHATEEEFRKHFEAFKGMKV